MPGNLQCENVNTYNPEKTRMEGQFGDGVFFSKVATKTVEKILLLPSKFSENSNIMMFPNTAALHIKKKSKCTLTDGPGTWKFVK